MVVQLRSCCCGCTLRTGTIIIAVLGVLGGIGFIIEGISQTSGAGHQGNSTKPWEQFVKPRNESSGNGTDIHDIVPGEHGFRVTQTIYGFVDTIINALLLAGAIRNSAKLIFPWIIVSVILCILGLIIFLGLGILTCVAEGVAFGGAYILVGIIGTVIHVYFILVVNSFHTTLKSGPVSRA